MTIISSQATATFIAVCSPCRRPRRVVDNDAKGRYVTVTCWQCGQEMQAERIHSAVSDAGCNGKCLNATGNSCSCECDGTNHGEHWVHEENEMLESSLEKYRADQARKDAARERREAAKYAKRVAAFNAWVSDNNAAETLEWLAATDIDHPFIRDMAYQVITHKPMTDRQLAAVEKFAANDRDRKARAEQEANEVPQPVPTGKAIEVTGTIVHVKSETSYYGYNEKTTYKMLIKGAGWKIWSTIPSGLQPNDYDEWWDLINGGYKGKGVTFTADITASDKDESFGFAKRPRKASFA